MSSPNLSPQRHHHHHHQHQLLVDDANGSACASSVANGTSSSAVGPTADTSNGSTIVTTINSSNVAGASQHMATPSNPIAASSRTGLDHDQRQSSAGSANPNANQSLVLLPWDVNQVASCIGDVPSARMRSGLSQDAAGSCSTATSAAKPMVKCSMSQVANSGDQKYRLQQQQQYHHQHQQPPTPSHQQKQLQATGNVLTMINPDTRTHVVGELYDTERSYVESLQILIEKYMKPLKNQDNNKALIDSNLVDEIFYTIPEILQHHENFLNALQERLSSDWDSSQVIGNVFIEAFTNQQIIDTYTKFINNWKNARHAIKVAIQAKPAFERFLEAMSREHRNKLTLDALLIMPVQRIPRYELLIKELIKHTPQDHPDHLPLMEAQKKIHDLALKIDRAEKEMLHQEQLKDLEALIENHAGMIQHPHRDFIRYDLVTISTSTLAVTRKERVLFLFCDLLIMTSVKKKVSRRSNLQAAFANSDHDISLLEGNKFKLILRVSLDQVEIRCDNNEQTQLWQQQQQIHEQNLMALAKHKKLIQEKKRELESDLLVLQQMELLSGQLVNADKTTLNVNLAQSIDQILKKLNSLELQQSDCENLSNAQQQLSLQQQSAQDSYLVQAPQTTTSLTLQQNHHTSNNLSPNLNTKEQQQSSSNPNEQDHQSSTKQNDASLEFIINNDATSKELSSANLNTSSKTLDENLGQNTLGSGHNIVNSLTPDGQQQQHGANCETLVVSFPSRDRRQAFIQAFLDAKQQRLKQQQKRMFSSSMTLKLSQPDQPLMKSRSIASDMRRNRLQHQDEMLDMRYNNSLGKHLDRQNEDRISSAPCAGTIGRCASCSSNYTLESADKVTNNRHGNHHHHQLMHQPASHPALLHTICCHEQHNDGSSHSIKSLNDKVEQLAELPENLLPENNYCDDGTRSGRVCNQDKGPYDSSTVSLLENDINECNQILLLKFVPRFLAAMPLNFLNTQHPALKLSCSVSRKPGKNFALDKQTAMFELGDKSIARSKGQTVRDNRGQLWLCLSNGYVSHISLVEFVSRDCDAKFIENSSKHCYNIVPVVKSGGDICKSQINCAAQVYWSVSKRNVGSFGCNLSATQKSDSKPGSDGIKSELNKPGDKIDPKIAAPPELSVKSASPPVNIEHSYLNRNESKERNISCSAPASSKVDFELDRLQASRLSSSATVPIESISRSDVTKGVFCQNTSSDGSTGRDGQRGASKRVINHRYQPHHHHHSQDQLRCRNHRCTSSLPCANSSYRRHRTTGSNANTIGQSRWSNQAINQHQQPAHGHHHNSQQHHHYHHHHHHHHHHVYNNKHHTVSLAELRRALERQSKLSDNKDKLSLPGGSGGGHRRHHLAPPANTPNQMKSDSLDLTESPETSERAKVQVEKSGRSNTPPGTNMSAGARTKQLRHQASLKTSAILAKLVSSAGKGSSYLKRSTNQSIRNKSDQSRNPSDMDDNETDMDQQNLKTMNQEGATSSVDSIQSITPAAVSGSNLGQQSNSIVSPLSSASSLNSSNSSSMMINSVCLSTPLHGSYARLLDQTQWPSSSCCIGRNQALSFVNHHQSSSSREDIDSGENFNLRSRSATVPCRAYCEQSRPIINCSMAESVCPEGSHKRLSSDERCGNEEYKVSEIIYGPEEKGDASDTDVHRNEITNPACLKDQSCLWLGCEDGSLIIIDCLATVNHRGACAVCNEDAEPRDRTIFTCQNVHLELRLGASISDIKCYMNRIVFVALADGRLAVFSRAVNNDGTLGECLLENPQIITVTANELNLTSKLCLIDEEHLWYSYGRNIFVFNISTLTLETTIMTPTNDKSVQFSMQTVTIDGMEVVPQLNGVWVSFRGSPLIQFYESKEYKLLLEMSLLEPINKVLSCGNEIIRQHKTACLGATSLLSLYNESEDSNSLFIGTTSGLILVLSISQKQLREQVEAERLAWNPQVISLRHGHSGQVKFLQVIELNRDPKRISMDVQDGDENIAGHRDVRDEEHRNSFILVSGGSGVDLYGPNDSQQNVQHDDSINHLVMWVI